jgi:hypothetical protein
MLHGAKFAGNLDMPILKPEFIIPKRLVSFSDAMNYSFHDYDCYIHGFEDDAGIERFWKNPHKYMNKIMKFKGVIGFDYSTCYDFPVPWIHINSFRNQATSYWLQTFNIPVIANVRCEPDNYEDLLAGIPHGSLIAIGARACIKNATDRYKFKQAVKCAVNYLEPSGIMWYGSDCYGTTSYPKSLGIPIYIYQGKGRGRITNGKEAGALVKIQ